MRKKLVIPMMLVFTAIVGTGSALAGANMALAGIPHTEPMDGARGFPSGSHLTESPYGSPTAGGATDRSDGYGESATRYWTDLDNFNQWHRWTLPANHSMDIRDIYLTWNATYFYIGVQGPNSLEANGDLFIGIDVASGGASAATWGRNINFTNWQPDFFIAVERQVSDTGGYAELRSPTAGIIKTFVNGTDAANSAWQADTAGGMFYEFRISFAEVGLTGGITRPIRLAVWTTHEHDLFGHNSSGTYWIGAELIERRAQTGADAYDTAPGYDQGTTYEQIGDYPGDADYSSDAGWGAPSSDNSLGAGMSVNLFDGASWNIVGSSPGSDYASGDTDTIGQYFEVLNFGTIPPTPTPSIIPANSSTGAILLLLAMTVLFARRRRA